MTALAAIAADFRALFPHVSWWNAPAHAATNASFRAVVLVRLLQRSPRTVSWALRNRLITRYGIDVARTASVGPGLRFPHPVGIVVGIGVTIGRDVTIYQNVTIGVGKGGYPVIGDGVIVYPGAVIVGGVSIGSGSVIGANEFVRVSLPVGTVFRQR